MATRPLDGIFPGTGHLKRRGVAIFCGTRRSIQMCTKSFLSIFIFFYFICGNWRPLGGHIKVQTRQKICDTKAFVCWVQQICGAVGARDKSTKSRGGGALLPPEFQFTNQRFMYRSSPVTSAAASTSRRLTDVVVVIIVAVDVPATRNEEEQLV